jgi:hypothetical protein
LIFIEKEEFNMRKNGKIPAAAKAIIFSALLLGAGAKGAAIEREGEIIFEREGVLYLNGLGTRYLLDTNEDGIDDTEMALIYGLHGNEDVTLRLIKIFSAWDKDSL